MSVSPTTPARWSDAWPPRLRRLLRRLAATWAALVLAATVAVLVGRETPTTPQFSGSSPRGERVDLARYDFGAVARVSSYLSPAQHHPLFAIDGRRSKNTLEKWVSDGADRAPWVEVLLPKAADIDAIRLVHGGAVESADYTMAAYTLRCFGADDVLIARLVVEGNRAPVAEHPLDCPAAVRVRVDFRVQGADTGQGVVRLYELEVMGVAHE